MVKYYLKEFLNIPSISAINVHASMLPEYRGAAPIHRAVMDGKESTGVTIIKMTEKNGRWRYFQL